MKEITSTKNNQLKRMEKITQKEVPRRTEPIYNRRISFS